MFYTIVDLIPQANHRPLADPQWEHRVRADVDAFIVERMTQWFHTVPYAGHLESDTIDMDYYRRRLTETAWRIRHLRGAAARALEKLSAGDAVSPAASATFGGRCGPRLKEKAASLP